jgi:hypothetical protein
VDEEAPGDDPGAFFVTCCSGLPTNVATALHRAADNAVGLLRQADPVGAI